MFTKRQSFDYAKPTLLKRTLLQSLPQMMEYGPRHVDVAWVLLAVIASGLVFGLSSSARVSRASRGYADRSINRALAVLSNGTRQIQREHGSDPWIRAASCPRSVD